MQLVCALIQIAKNVYDIEEGGKGPCHSSVFELLVRMRSRLRSKLDLRPRIESLRLPAPDAGLDVVLLLGTDPNVVALKSLLAHRKSWSTACGARLDQICSCAKSVRLDLLYF